MNEALRAPEPPASPLTAWLGDVAARAQAGAVSVLLAALGHVLHQQAWARDRLRVHAGATVRIGIQALPGRSAPDLHVTVTPDGLLVAAPAHDVASATLLLNVSPQVAVSLMRDGPQGIVRHLRIDGDAMLVAALGELARHLRWDAEEDLSKVVGDVAAHRLANFARTHARGLAELGPRVQSGAARFAASGGAPVAGSGQAHWLRENTQELERRVQRLESRVALLRTAV